MSEGWIYGGLGEPTPRFPDKTRIPLIALGGHDGLEVEYMGPAMQMPKPRRVSYVSEATANLPPASCTVDVVEFRIHFWRPCWSAAPSPRYVQRELEPQYT